MRWWTLVLLWPSSTAFACHNPCKVPDESAAFGRATRVFLGEVMGKKQEGSTATLAFKLSRSWKGEPSSWVDVKSEFSTCDPMGNDAKIGDKYLVFASLTASGLTTGLCSGSRAMRSEKTESEAIKLMDSLASSTPRLSATPDAPPKDPEKYVEWGQKIFNQLAVCKQDSDCTISHYGCPWGCGTPLNRDADAKVILKVVREYPGQSCKYQCSSEVVKAKCIQGFCKAK